MARSMCTWTGKKWQTQSSCEYAESWLFIIFVAVCRSSHMYTRCTDNVNSNFIISFFFVLNFSLCLSAFTYAEMSKCAQHRHGMLEKARKKIFFFVFRFWKQQIHDVTIRISHVCLWCRMIRDYLMVSLFSLGDGREKKNERTMSEASKEKHDISPFRMRSPCERYILHARRTHFTLVIWKTQIMCPVERTLSHWERYLTAERRKKN